MFPSISEQRFLESCNDDYLTVLSIWISTWWFWEAILALDNPKRNIVATTIDERWMEYSQEFFEKIWVSHQIKTKLEDVSKKSNYDDNFFDTVYARLVLHYLSEQKLQVALSELYRVMKKNAKIHIVVRSKNDLLTDEYRKYEYDNISKYTTTLYLDKTWEVTGSSKRFFHTRETISRYINEAWFEISSIEEISRKTMWGLWT